MKHAPSFGIEVPETPQKSAWLGKIRNNIAAIATSILALTSAEAGPLTRDVMTNDPYIFNASWIPSATKNIFDLNDIMIRLAADPNAPIYDTTWSLEFRDDGTLFMLLNVDENWSQVPAYSTMFELVPVEENPGVFILNINGVYSWGLFWWPGYPTVDVLPHDSGIRFTEYSPTPAIPEPGTLPLMGLWLAWVAYGYSKRKKEEKAK